MKEIKTYPLKDKFVKLQGEFWVGDPCYIFADRAWQRLCKLMYPEQDNNKPDFDDKETVRVVTVDGVKCYLFGTAHGDGSYDLKHAGNDMGELGVDAGMLSIIPMEIVKLRGWGETKWAGIEITVSGNHKKEITVDGGDIVIGDYSINTSGNDESYDDYDDEDDYNEEGEDGIPGSELNMW